MFCTGPYFSDKFSQLIISKISINNKDNIDEETGDGSVSPPAFSQSDFAYFLSGICDMIITSLFIQFVNKPLKEVFGMSGEYRWKISTQQIGIFLKSMKMRNLRQVADYYNYTPSTVSKTIMSLE